MNRKTERFISIRKNKQLKQRKDVTLRPDWNEFESHHRIENRDKQRSNLKESKKGGQNERGREREKGVGIT